MNLKYQTGFGNEFATEARECAIKCSAKVTVTGSVPDAKDELTALVQLNIGEKFEEINNHLLENGIAKFNNFSHANLVPMTTACELGKAEARAREKGVGVWAVKPEIK